MFFQNNLEGHTYGAELSGNYQLLDHWSVHLGYDLLQEHLHVKPGQFDLDAALNETSDPQQQVSVRSSATLIENVEFDTALRWVDTLKTNDGATPGIVPSYFRPRCKTGLARRAGPGAVLVGQNLLQPRHVEYGFPSPLREPIDRSVVCQGGLAILTISGASAAPRYIPGGRCAVVAPLKLKHVRQHGLSSPASINSTRPAHQFSHRSEYSPRQQSWHGADNAAEAHRKQRAKLIADSGGFRECLDRLV